MSEFEKARDNKYPVSEMGHSRDFANACKREGADWARQETLREVRSFYETMRSINEHMGYPFSQPLINFAEKLKKLEAESEG